MLIIQLVELIVDFECAFSSLTLLVGHQEVHPVRKKSNDEVLVWLSVWSKMQSVCVLSS